MREQLLQPAEIERFGGRDADAFARKKRFTLAMRLKPGLRSYPIYKHPKWE